MRATPEQIAAYAAETLARGGTVGGPAEIPAGAVETHSKAPVGKLSEAKFQEQVIEYAQARGWWCAHFRKVRVTRGSKTFWETPAGADGVGFPDLVFAREGRVIVAELKVAPNKPSERQREWLKRLNGFCWYPEDWDEIRRILA